MPVEGRDYGITPTLLLTTSPSRMEILSSINFFGSLRVNNPVEVVVDKTSESQDRLNFGFLWGCYFPKVFRTCIHD